MMLNVRSYVILLRKMGSINQISRTKVPSMDGKKGSRQCHIRGFLFLNFLLRFCGNYKINNNI